MEEFINKLIAKLDQKKTTYRYLYKNCKDDTVVQYDLGRCDGIREAMVIVREVAEEFCEDTNGTTNGWMPCTIAMPEKEQLYEVTMEIVICSGPQYVTDYALLDSNGKWLKGCRFKNGKVIAWKEKTEPYVPKREVEGE